ncbi:hypothetical protein AB0H86_35475 [Streptomyces sp. NPDC050997]|uniref:hypothetical protein n=1 Tax=Streptomyces sp. NPDC050997 TaxID=3155519 RepID=UPI00344524BC
MPYPPPSRTPSGPRRRALLVSAAGAAALSAGCSAGSDGSGERAGGSPSVTARARARAARDSRGLTERYDAVLTAYPALADRLGPLRAAVARHTEAFGGAAQGASGKASEAAASPPPSASPSPAVPGTERDALAELAAAERSLADRRAKALLEVPGELARLLASVAAAGAAHAYLLTEDTK